MKFAAAGRHLIFCISCRNRLGGYGNDIAIAVTSFRTESVTQFYFDLKSSLLQKCKVLNIYFEDGQKLHNIISYFYFMRRNCSKIFEDCESKPSQCGNRQDSQPEVNYASTIKNCNIKVF